MVRPNCLLRLAAKAWAQGTKLDLSGTRGLGHLQGMLAAHLAAVRADPLVSDQAGDVGPDRGDFLEELFDGLELGHGPAAAGAGQQGDLGLVVDMVRDGPIRAGVSRLPPGPLLLGLGNLLAIRATEGSGLACRDPERLVELILEGMVVLLQLLDSGTSPRSGPPIR